VRLRRWFSLSLSLVVVGGFGMRRDLCWSVGGESTNLDAWGYLSIPDFFLLFFLFSFARGCWLAGMNLYLSRGDFLDARYHCFDFYSFSFLLLCKEACGLWVPTLSYTRLVICIKSL
jgi:hypothetical protein